MRSVERTVEEVLLPALDMAASRANQEAELARLPLGDRLASPARRLAHPASRPEGVLLLDSGAGIGTEAVETLALELFLRRSGLRVLLLSANLEGDRFARALRALDPRAAVLCGTEARLDVLGPHLRRLLNEGPQTRLYGYRAARLVSGQSGLPAIGPRPGEAAETLLAAIV